MNGMRFLFCNEVREGTSFAFDERDLNLSEAMAREEKIVRFESEEEE
jgi:hypothetical protein